MKLYVCGRGTGKTKRAIQMSCNTNAVIVCNTSFDVEYATKLAAKLGLQIPTPITIHDFYNIPMETKEYIFDDVDIDIVNLCLDQTAAAFITLVNNFKEVEIV